MNYKIEYSDGRVSNINETLNDALSEIRETYPDMVILHEPDRVLIWESEAESKNDDGSNTIASVWLPDHNDEIRAQVDREMPANSSVTQPFPKGRWA